MKIRILIWFSFLLGLIGLGQIYVGEGVNKQPAAIINFSNAPVYVAIERSINNTNWFILGATKVNNTNKLILIDTAVDPNKLTVIYYRLRPITESNYFQIKTNR